uniref:Putative secreted protein n=1 Tax=Anopheles marajoara TaxID=58244 RepID=A0A2M4C7X2_9DIPT
MATISLSFFAFLQLRVQGQRAVIATAAHGGSARDKRPAGGWDSRPPLAIDLSKMTKWQTINQTPTTTECAPSTHANDANDAISGGVGGRVRTSFGDGGNMLNYPVNPRDHPLI